MADQSGLWLDRRALQNRCNLVQRSATRCNGVAPVCGSRARVANRKPAERARLAGRAESPATRGQICQRTGGRGKSGRLPCPRRAIEHVEEGFNGIEGNAS